MGAGCWVLVPVAIGTGCSIKWRVLVFCLKVNYALPLTFYLLPFTTHLLTAIFNITARLPTTDHRLLPRILDLLTDQLRDKHRRKKLSKKSLEDHQHPGRGTDGCDVSVPGGGEGDKTEIGQLAKGAAFIDMTSAGKECVGIGQVNGQVKGGPHMTDENIYCDSAADLWNGHRSTVKDLHHDQVENKDHVCCQKGAVNDKERFAIEIQQDHTIYKDEDRYGIPDFFLRRGHPAGGHGNEGVSKKYKAHQQRLPPCHAGGELCGNGSQRHGDQEPDETFAVGPEAFNECHST